MENIPQWHGSVKLTREQAETALTALGAKTPGAANAKRRLNYDNCHASILRLSPSLLLTPSAADGS